MSFSITRFSVEAIKELVDGTLEEVDVAMTIDFLQSLVDDDKRPDDNFVYAVAALARFNGAVVAVDMIKALVARREQLN